MPTIPIAFYLVMLELSIGSFLVLFALDVRNDTSINFVRFQGVLYLFLFTLLTWGTLNGFASTALLRDSFKFNLDFRYLQWQSPLLLWFMLLQVPYNIVLLVAKQARNVRLVFGGVACLLGVADLLCVGMAFRGIAAGVLGGLPTVAAFVAGALSLGGVSTAMLLGHWYLNTPTASGKPLEFATVLTIVGIIAQITFGLVAGPVTYSRTSALVTASSTIAPITTYPAIERMILPKTIRVASDSSVSTAPTPTPQPGGSTVTSPVPHGVIFNNLTLTLLQYLLGFGLPLILTGIAFFLERQRSFQSATGMLYIAVVFAFFGEILARNLFLQPLL